MILWNGNNITDKMRMLENQGLIIMEKMTIMDESKTVINEIGLKSAEIKEMISKTGEEETGLINNSRMNYIEKLKKLKSTIKEYGKTL
jgi:hypothetical protein